MNVPVLRQDNNVPNDVNNSPRIPEESQKLERHSWSWIIKTDYMRMLDSVVQVNDSKLYLLTYPDVALSWKWYLTVRGAECFHIYLWIAKDWSWTQDWYYAGLLFGSAAVAWSFILLYRAILFRNPQEIYHSIAQILWLFANLWWMQGELHDEMFPDAPPMVDQRQLDAGNMMIGAIAWLTVYYVILRPFNLIPISERAKNLYDDTGLTCRWSKWIFPTWRAYENVHILFWLGKDCAWNLLFPAMWITFLIPTLLIAFDFMLVACFNKHLMIERAHYTAQFIWVCGNMVWALGEFYFAKYDEPLSMGERTYESRHTLRWWSSWLLCSAYLPIFLLYMVWIPLTLMGRLPTEEELEKRRKEAEAREGMELGKQASTERLHADSDSGAVTTTVNPILETLSKTGLINHFTKNLPTLKTDGEQRHSGGVVMQQKSAPNGTISVSAEDPQSRNDTMTHESNSPGQPSSGLFSIVGLDEEEDYRERYVDEQKYEKIHPGSEGNGTKDYVDPDKSMSINFVTSCLPNTFDNMISKIEHTNSKDNLGQVFEYSPVSTK